MKIIVSSKQLAVQLNEFDFKNDSIQAVRAENSKLFLDSQKKTVEIWCEISEFRARIVQESVKWDYIKNLVNQVDEQPIVLEITKNFVSVIFQY